ncbi:MAG: phosphoglucosamine mutase [Candidatus Thioglobus sp.]|uniref:phosphoglucosamine mutase n=1 Tax=Candidatus Thioglobus sp. TaxID=2026721 RepID=UPI0001BD360C|nr:phosphoglucosamine mutase [Candidatus Thioglobus sp.]EEZ80513.1 MAG: phosphomannomutase [uncultured Candidatus Thioglobus sp.]MBT3186905.1 phosphoglucosamine mutase [Candidatus Thioglobus sp.]MBT3432149.1 phosphoglucosamine mutase [Candidatus Thioglobus sp.]MBT4315623.1 phosphoglucosamine mutase [Candidatus Thioglobus sp.]MBT4923560.1 phosphoglucosamine mutase [Candidatus Thioglobus sp.]
MGQFFGTDGIRGRVGEEPITADFFLKLGWAVGSVLAKDGSASVIIGKDTRVSGYLFESALEAGFLSAGVDVGLLGPMPTPAVAYLTQAYGATAGVVISASHNHFQDNGVKFFSSQGFKLSDENQKEIEAKLSESMISVDSDNIGKAHRHEQPLGRYIEFCKSTFDRSVDLSGLNIVIDCANGATYHIAENVFSELGANITIINNQPDGFNINLNCGATDTKQLQRVVVEQKFDLGIAFDGDGDRLMMVDTDGKLVDGDELVFIIAKAWKDQSRLVNNAVVGTKMTNLGMRHALKDLGINFIETDVGDRFVMEQMQSSGSILGGEGSGHIICLDKTTSGDGIVSALQVLEVLAKSHKSLGELKKEMEKYPQVLINVKTKSKVDLDNHADLKQAQLEVEESLGDEGRVLIRASGTEPLIRVMVEGKNLTLVQQSADKLVKILSP